LNFLLEEPFFSENPKSFSRVFPQWLLHPSYIVYLDKNRCPAPPTTLLSFVPLFNFTLTAKLTRTPNRPIFSPPIDPFTRRLVATTRRGIPPPATPYKTPIKPPDEPRAPCSWHSLIANYYSLMSSSCWWMNAKTINCALGQRYWTIFCFSCPASLLFLGSEGRESCYIQSMGHINLFTLFKFLFW